MVEIRCKNCEAIFVIDGLIVPQEMTCFCNCEEFEVKEDKKEIVA